MIDIKKDRQRDNLPEELYIFCILKTFRKDWPVFSKTACKFTPNCMTKKVFFFFTLIFYVIETVLIVDLTFKV